MNYKKYITDGMIQPIKTVGIFTLLIFGFHFLFNYWTYSIHYWPINFQIKSVYQYLTDLAYENSVYLLRIMTDYKIKTDDTIRAMWYGSGKIYITPGCSGLKQFLQWLVLMLFFPGPFKHKLWFIPTGLVILYAFNILRIIGLTFALDYFPHYWNFLHLDLFRFLFYALIFGLWVIWVEFIAYKSQKKEHLIKH